MTLRFGMWQCLEKNIGYAFVQIEFANAGDILRIKSPYAELDAKVVELPFYDPHKDIPKGRVN